ncbi:MAG: carboxypeptidase M32 [Alphaproteobacteria bacterium]|nr:carboxypeptidase M32 [Alphaproteobacteria bacterium]
MVKAYLTLEKVFKKIDDIQGARSVLQWDSAVMMPPGSSEVRGDQLATLQKLEHAILSDPDIGGLLDEAENHKAKLNPWQKANLCEMKRSWKHITIVDSKLIEALVKAGTTCEHAWREARKNNDFETYRPLQQKVLDLVREVAKVKGAAFGCSPYEALIDQYDPGMKEKTLSGIFESLEAFLPEFVQSVLEHQSKNHKVTAFKEKVSVEKQKALAEFLLDKLGFDRQHGRFDTSTHPFCGGVPGDVRITSRYDEENPLSSMYGVIHENGHALYESGLPCEWRSQPVGKARGMGVHESQSLLWEMQIGMSHPFMEFAVPHMKQIYGSTSRALSASNIYRTVTKVEPSLIRVDADEVTYPGHILLRYHLEQYMIKGDLNIDELPDAWEQGMLKYLNIKVPDNKDGCMQDIHWTDGTFGYFPSYTIGAILAAQIFQTVEQAIPDLSEQTRQGEFSSLRKWLQEHLHGLGSRYTTNTLIEKVTGKPLDIECYKNHLRKRYLA